MVTAITRAVSPAIVHCELSFIDRKPIDLARAQEQHRAYEKLLEKLGASVISLPPEPELPDSMFVEDPAIVLYELAVILPLGTETRRREAASLAQALSRFRKLEYVTLPGTLEGGDVLQIGNRVFVGLSSRTNAEGIRQLTVILAPYGYEVISVMVTGCLHLKSAVTYLGRKQASNSRATFNTLLANRAWFDTKPFTGFEWIDVDPAEPHAANALAFHSTIIFPTSFPRTRARIEARGFHVTPLDISELQKAESGLTCSSLLFAYPNPAGSRHDGSEDGVLQHFINSFEQKKMATRRMPAWPFFQSARSQRLWMKIKLQLRGGFSAGRRILPIL